jgi:hypothetical protein
MKGMKRRDTAFRRQTQIIIKDKKTQGIRVHQNPKSGLDHRSSKRLNISLKSRSARHAESADGTGEAAGISVL